MIFISIFTTRVGQRFQSLLGFTSQSRNPPGLYRGSIQPRRLWKIFIKFLLNCPEKPLKVAFYHVWTGERTTYTRRKEYLFQRCQLNTNHLQGYNRMQAWDWWIPILCWQRWTRYSFRLVYSNRKRAVARLRRDSANVLNVASHLLSI